MTALRVLFAPDSFKGSLDSVAVAAALADGWRRARPADELLLAPLADGGEGTLRAIEAAEPPGLSRRLARVADPLGRPIEAGWLVLGAAGRRAAPLAVLELAAASGLSRLAPNELDALGAGTEGTGDLLLAALDAGHREVILGIGGSATTDGGAGILRRLGARLLDAAGRDLPPGGGALERLDRVDLAGLDPRLAELRLTIASDVQNPLLGPEGAAAVYGPQKGAAPADAARLDAALGRYAALLEAATDRLVRDAPGSGAAGGVAAGLLAIADRLAGLDVRPGVELVMELTRFEERLRGCQLVVTGEGRLDAQTAFGKTVLGVARRARAAGLPCLVIAGSVGPGGREALGGLVEEVVPTVSGPTSVEAAMAAGAGPVADAAERTARLVSLGGRLEA